MAAPLLPQRDPSTTVGQQQQQRVNSSGIFTYDESSCVSHSAARMLARLFKLYFPVHFPDQAEEESMLYDTILCQETYTIFQCIEGIEQTQSRILSDGEIMSALLHRYIFSIITEKTGSAAPVDGSVVIAFNRIRDQNDDVVSRASIARIFAQPIRRERGSVNFLQLAQQQEIPPRFNVHIAKLSETLIQIRLALQNGHFIPMMYVSDNLQKFRKTDPFTFNHCRGLLGQISGAGHYYTGYGVPPNGGPHSSIPDSTEGSNGEYGAQVVLNDPFITTLKKYIKKAQNGSLYGMFGISPDRYGHCVALTNINEDPANQDVQLVMKETITAGSKEFWRDNFNQTLLWIPSPTTQYIGYVSLSSLRDYVNAGIQARLENVNQQYNQNERARATMSDQYSTPPVTSGFLGYHFRNAADTNQEINKDIIFSFVKIIFVNAKFTDQGQYSTTNQAPASAQAQAQAQASFAVPFVPQAPAPAPGPNRTWFREPGDRNFFNTSGPLFSIREADDPAASVPLPPAPTMFRGFGAPLFPIREADDPAAASAAAAARAAASAASVPLPPAPTRFRERGDPLFPIREADDPAAASAAARTQNRRFVSEEQLQARQARRDGRAVAWNITPMEQNARAKPELAPYWAAERNAAWEAWESAQEIKAQGVDLFDPDFDVKQARARHESAAWAAQVAEWAVWIAANMATIENVKEDMKQDVQNKVYEKKAAMEARQKAVDEYTQLKAEWAARDNPKIAEAAAAMAEVEARNAAQYQAMVASHRPPQQSSRFGPPPPGISGAALLNFRAAQQKRLNAEDLARFKAQQLAADKLRLEQEQRTPQSESVTNKSPVFAPDETEEGNNPSLSDELLMSKRIPFYKTHKPPSPGHLRKLVDKTKEAAYQAASQAASQAAYQAASHAASQVASTLTNYGTYLFYPRPDQPSVRSVDLRGNVIRKAQLPPPEPGIIRSNPTFDPKTGLMIPGRARLLPNYFDPKTGLMIPGRVRLLPNYNQGRGKKLATMLHESIKKKRKNKRRTHRKRRTHNKRRTHRKRITHRKRRTHHKRMPPMTNIENKPHKKTRKNNNSKL